MADRLPKATILVVDDDEHMRHLTGRALSPSYEVLEADGVTAALEIMRRHRVDLVVIDVMMPGVNGLDGCRAIKAAAKEYLPVLMLTALGEQEDRNAGLEAGADDFLTKPVNRRELSLRVSTFLRLRNQEVLIKRQLNELRELIALKDDLVNILVHDLRNPLAAVLSSFRLLDRTITDPNDKEDIRIGLDAAGRVNELVEDLLHVKMLEEGRLTLALETLPAGSVVREAVETLRPMAQERNVELVLAAGSDTPLPIDRKLVRRAVENLITNALKYTRGRVDVGVSHVAGSDAEVTVADEGPGIPDALKSGLFEKFGSVEASRGQTRRGIGLGLYMVRLVAAAHGGTVAVEDRSGGGTVFRLTLRGDS